MIALFFTVCCHGDTCAKSLKMDDFRVLIQDEKNDDEMSAGLFLEKYIFLKSFCFIPGEGKSGTPNQKPK